MPCARLGLPFRPTKLEQDNGTGRVEVAEHRCRRFACRGEEVFRCDGEAEAAFKADLEKLLKNEGHMPEDKFLVMSRKGKRLGVAFAGAPREGGASLKFKTK